MRHWSQLATRNWSANKSAFLATVISVGLGVAIVVAVTSFYESAVAAVKGEVVGRWLGSAHITIDPPGAHWGSLEASLAEPIRKVDHVAYVSARLKRPMVVVPPPRAQELLPDKHDYVDAIGIDPGADAPFQTLPEVRGRFLQPGDRGVCVIESTLQEHWAFDLGDALYLAAYRGGAARPLTIVGIFDSQRLADFQREALYLPIEDAQAIKNQPGAATTIDVMVDDPTPQRLAQTKADIEALLAERDLAYTVESAQARLAQLDEAERLTRMIVVLASVITLLTAFFIILTTMSASLYARRRLLGLMRCVGVTRGQLIALVFVEVTPPTVVGVLVGVPLGLLLIHWTVGAGGGELPPIHTSGWGLIVAIECAAATWLTSIGILVLQVCTVSPLRAAHPQSRPPRFVWVYASAAAGVVLMLLHEWSVWRMDPGLWADPLWMWIGGSSQFVGFVLVVPLIVAFLGAGLATLAGPLFGLRAALARDQFGRAPWLSAGVCWVLMVSVSLIVYMAVRSEGIMRIWDFPARLPEAFVWAPQYSDAGAIERIESLPGVGKVTAVADVDCKIDVVGRETAEASNPFLQSLLSRLTRPVFVAGDPDTFLSMARLGFAESTEEEVRAKLERGGYVLVPPQTARARDLKKGDRITVTVGSRSAEFEVADVVESPALDIAVTFFKAESYMQFAAAAAVIGTRADLRDRLGRDVVSMVMCNVDLPPADVPAIFQNRRPPAEITSKSVAALVPQIAAQLPNEWAVLERIIPELRAWTAGTRVELSDDVRTELTRFERALRYTRYHWRRQTPEQNWRTFRERLVLFKVANAMGKPDAIMGSLQRLRENLERDVRRAILVLTWLPGISLVISIVGITNLITVRVLARRRHLAVLRAVGATKSQIVRLILAESTTLGLLGGIAGIILGFYSARSDNVVGDRLAGLGVEWVVPWGTIIAATLLTVGTCILAGIGPARHAARDDVVSALEAG
ncbi:MAG: FtsX-like permease family protein [Phycisphaerales bacterium]|nr:MAG: FtsX-like permease family protein [Phycisphaerales bacterium]